MVFSFGWSFELYVLFPCFFDAILSNERLVLLTLVSFLGWKLVNVLSIVPSGLRFSVPSLRNADTPYTR